MTKSGASSAYTHVESVVLAADVATVVGAPRISEPSGKDLIQIFSGLMMVLILASLDQNILNTALPRIVSELGGLSHLSWVVAAFLVTSTLSTPIYGKLSDMYGRKPLLTGAIAIFLTGSILCGAAQSMTQLILFRALQGLGAGGLISLAQTLIGDLVGPRRRPKYQAYFTGAFAFSTLTGPIIGGLLTTHLSWRWVFYVNLPVGALALLIIVSKLHIVTPRRGHQVDYMGALLLALGTTALLLPLSLGGGSLPWNSIELTGLVATAVVFLILFLAQELHTPEPLLDPKLFRNKTFSIGIGSAALMSFAMMGTMLFVPLYFQLVLNMSPDRAGFMMLPQVIWMMISSIIGGRLVSAQGHYKLFLSVGLFLEAAGLGGIGLSAAIGDGPIGFEIALGLLGVGMGIGMPNMTNAVQNSVRRADLGVATATQSFMRSFGGAFGVTTAGAVLSGILHQSLTGLVHGASPGAERSLAVLATLAPAARQAAVAAYQHAIAASMSFGGAVMGTVFLICVFGMPGQPLRD